MTGAAIPTHLCCCATVLLLPAGLHAAEERSCCEFSSFFTRFLLVSLRFSLSDSRELRLA